MTLLDGTELEGKFKNGNLIEGIRIYPEGKYEGGEYEDGKLIGGLTVLSDGVSLNGDYQNGQLIKGQRISNDETLIEIGDFQNDYLMYPGNCSIFQRNFHSSPDEAPREVDFSKQTSSVSISEKTPTRTLFGLK